MDNFSALRDKLEAFIRRYYFNELLKGIILFLSFGLLYFLIVLALEYFLWFSTTGRRILFWLFVVVETFLFCRFIVFPILKLFRISKGIDYTQASRIIGSHFPEVRDKLLNLLQLQGNKHQSELLLAGIDQKSAELKPVRFNLAVDFKSNLPFLKYAAIPVVVILLIILSGKTDLFADSYERVVNYKQAYAPPAPFTFQVMNDKLSTRANEGFKLQVRTIGNVLPERPSIHYNGETYFLNVISPGLYEFDFEPLEKSVSFHLSGNKVSSDTYTLDVIEVPEMINFQMHLNYPPYTGIKNTTLEGSGNATIPEGTVVEWKLKTRTTDAVSFRANDSVTLFQKESNEFSLQKRALKELNYEISTSNAEVKEYENLKYTLEVVKDEFPELNLEQKIDSLEGDAQYFFGKISDDYGISGARLVYYQTENSEKKNLKDIPLSGGSYAEFLHVFPGDLQLEEGRAYAFYFEVFDNDRINGPKSVKSRSFYYRIKTEEERKEERLEQQSESIDELGKSLEKIKASEQELKEIFRLQKQKKTLDYSDRKKLRNFLDRQEKQQAIMKEYSQKLKKTLAEEKSKENNILKQQLEERLEKKEERLEENEELLEELKKYGEKINEEELGKKLEKLSKNNQNQEKSLEQLLELTKKYYVEEKAAKIARDAEELGKKQKELSEAGEKNTKEAQDSLNNKFDDLLEEIKNLEEENQKLKTPTETGVDKELENEIKEEQNKASDALENRQKKEAGEHQKKAGEKMQKMGKKMQKQQQMSSGEQMMEDSKLLRKILDNLVVFSFEQEGLLEEFRQLSRDNHGYAEELRQQNLLKEHFKHVDDSLYALALRNPMITESITEKLTDVEFALNKSLERLADNQMSQGMASQQYAITGANDLAVFLSKILENMQNMMNSSGSGGSGDMQLPDIIKKQEQLNREMQDGLQKQNGKKGKEPGKENGKGSEEQNGEIFRIFQEQQRLRQQLEDIMKEKGLDGEGEPLKKDMEKIEEELLRNGLNDKTLQKMLNLEHKLLELEDAKMRQGQKQERESNTNRKEFENPAKDQIIRAKEYFNTTEILNRQTLPLRQIYKRKVKEYFERGDH